MQSQEEKRAAFIKAITEYAEEQRLRILSETDEFTGEQIRRAEQEAASDAARIFTRETAQVRSEITRKLAAAELSGRKQLFEKRSAIEEQVFEEAGKRLAEFTKTDGYVDYLMNAAGKIAAAFAAAPDATVFRLRSRDMRYADAISERYAAQCECVADDSIRLGGLLAVNEQLGIAIDSTLDARLERQRDRFRLEAELYIN